MPFIREICRRMYLLLFGATYWQLDHFDSLSRCYQLASLDERFCPYWENFCCKGSSGLFDFKLFLVVAGGLGRTTTPRSFPVNQRCAVDGRAVRAANCVGDQAVELAVGFMCIPCGDFDFFE